MSTALVRQDPKMSGRDKVAILYMALGAEQAAKITQRLSQDEVELISLAIAKLNRVEPETAEGVLMDWIEVRPCCSCHEFLSIHRFMDFRRAGEIRASRRG